jgi:hypothetical protein
MDSDIPEQDEIPEDIQQGEAPAEQTGSTSETNVPVFGEAPASGEVTSTSPISSPASLAHVNLSMDIPDGMRLRITLEAFSRSEEGKELGPARTLVVSEWDGSQDRPLSISMPVAIPEVVARAPRRPWPASQLVSNLRSRVRAWPLTLQTTLFSLAVLIYLLTRLIGLTSFPIYFFTDEAVQTLLAADLVKDNLKSYDGEFLPTYFKNVDQYNLSTSVYLQVLPYLFFGKSEFINRLTSLLVTLLAAISVSLILRDIFKLPYWWSATLWLSIIPAWFLHTRTSFETVLMVSFYAAALYYYLLYRYRSPHYLYAALGLFALAFYSYSPGQVVVVATGLLLLISDVRYHWQNRAVGLRGFGLVILFALPYLRFNLDHRTATADHLANLGSYWFQPISFQEKISRYWSEYAYGLSPGYWFFENGRDLARHLMKGYGHMLKATLPLAILGLALCLKNIRSSAHRALLIAFLAAPTGAALALITITRALLMVIPATLFTAMGMIALLTWLQKRISPTILGLVLFASLSLFNLYMMRDALVNGPTWYQDYGMGGMQYGGEQLFGAIKEYMVENPTSPVLLTPAWANGPDLVARFFLSDPLPIQLGNIDLYMARRLPLPANMAFVMIPDEYQRAVASGKFTDIHILKTLPYPNRQPGFYFVSLRYVDNIDAILAAEKEARRALHEDQVLVDGQMVTVRYSMLDMGKIQDAFDGNPRSVVRTYEADPFVIELVFSEPRDLSGLSIIIGDTEVNTVVRLYSSPDATPVELTYALDGSVQQPEVSMDFGQTFLVKVLHLEILDQSQTEPAHVHLWEVYLR